MPGPVPKRSEELMAHSTKAQLAAAWNHLLTPERRNTSPAARSARAA
ncbi:hypothetical protein ATK30_0210 [Amycolatopsis echigonensis]|uniref:Uncharacterized protein n=1 Tax=Amycolatopsis echigonensis TaxID=2576905 RepID=A0A2N3X1Z2_9PSEU|nr:hypothetical protein [Amycolatopsis niigatensis]PKW00126.1 hypothetical protein ATK30_0210 [Amycolatopsis niigatensis]